MYVFPWGVPGLRVRWEGCSCHWCNYVRWRNCKSYVHYALCMYLMFRGTDPTESKLRWRSSKRRDPARAARGGSSSTSEGQQWWRVTVWDGLRSGRAWIWCLRECLRRAASRGIHGGGPASASSSGDDGTVHAGDDGFLGFLRSFFYFFIWDFCFFFPIFGCFWICFVWVVGCLVMAWGEGRRLVREAVERLGTAGKW